MTNTRQPRILDNFELKRFFDFLKSLARLLVKLLIAKRIQPRLKGLPARLGRIIRTHQNEAPRREVLVLKSLNERRGRLLLLGPATGTSRGSRVRTH